MKKIIVTLIITGSIYAQDDIILKSAGMDASKGIVFQNSNADTLMDINGDGLISISGSLTVKGPFTLSNLLFPTSDGTNGQVLTTNGSGSLSWTNIITTDTDDQNLNISGDTLYISEGNSVSLASYKDNTDTQDLSLTADTLSLSEGGSVIISNATSVVANTAKVGVPTAYTLPSADGTNGQILKTNGSGTISWTSISSASGNGATSINELSDALVEDNSIYLGNDPSSTTSTAQYNVGVGIDVMNAVTTGDNNVGVGYNALTANTTGSGNTAIGKNALQDNTTGAYNTGMGRDALGNSTTGGANTAIGTQALVGNTTGARNNAIGSGALDEADTENDNLAIGYYALGGAIAGGEKNVAIGNYSMDALTAGDKNTGVGYNVLTGLTTGSWNTAVGHEAGKAMTTGADNTAIGLSAGAAITTGTRNVAIGGVALDNADGENDNLAIGYAALGGAVNGGETNVAIGNYSMDALTSGDANTAVGYGSLGAQTTGNDNTSYGYNSLSASTTGFKNTAIGYQTGDALTTGSKNVILGTGSNVSAASAINQTVIGYQATGHGDNIAVIGNTDVTAWHPADDNGVDLGSSSYEYKDLYVDGVAYLDGIGMGSTAMTLPTADGSNGQVLKTDGSGTLSWTANSGSGASNITGLSDALTEDNSVYLGSDPSSTTSTAEYNVAVGMTALDAVTTGDRNTAIGYNVLSANTTGYYNTASGANALKLNTTGYLNVAIGESSLGANTTGNQNVAIGTYSLTSNTTAGGNTAIGTYASYYNTTGHSNVGIGYESLRYNATGSYNVAVGRYSLNGASGNNLSRNTALGHKAGYALATGTDNVILGYESAASATDADNQIVIGQGATGHGDNIAVIGNGSATAIHPHDDNEVDLGSSSYNYKDLYLAGDATIGGSATFKEKITIISSAGNTDLSSDTQGGKLFVNANLDDNTILLPQATSSNVGLTYKILIGSIATDFKVGFANGGSTEFRGQITLMSDANQDSPAIADLAVDSQNFKVFNINPDANNIGGGIGSVYELTYITSNLVFISGTAVVNSSAANGTPIVFSSTGI